MTVKERLLSTGYYVDNEYLHKYVQLIESNCNTPKIKLKTQSHHILPRSTYKLMGQMVDESDINRVNLLYKDHILAHYYLALCSSSKDNRYFHELAMQYMLGNAHLPKADKEFIYKLDSYQSLYEDAQFNNSEAHKGLSPWNKGLTYSVGPMDESRKEKIRDSAVGRYTNHIWINKQGKNRHVSPDKVSVYLMDGYKIGRDDQECFRKISESQKASPNLSMLGKHQRQHQKDAVSAALKGKPKSDAARSKMSKSRLGKIMVTNPETLKIVLIYPYELDNYLSIGYVKGRIKKSS